MSEPAVPWCPTLPPGVDELVTDDGIPMETPRHHRQKDLLIDSLELAWEDRQDFYVGGDMFFYYSVLQTKKHNFRGPDVFVVLPTERRERKAWVVWEEDGKCPNVIIELTSPSTAEIDRGPKKRIYATLHIPLYFIYDPFTAAFEGYSLDFERHDYEPLEPTPEGRLCVPLLDLELGVWQGRHRGTDGPWLRWFRPDGTVLPAPEEALAEAEQARAQAEQARAQAEQAGVDLAARLAAYEERFGKLG